MERMRVVLLLMFAVLFVLGVAVACGDGGGDADGGGAATEVEDSGGGGGEDGSDSDAQFEGGATATVELDGQTFNFKDGFCNDSEVGFALNLGDPLGDTYLGISIIPETGDTIAMTYEGTDYLINNAEVTLNAARDGGTFTGETDQGQTVSGSFEC